MSPNLTALLYLASGVLFILALRGLASPVSARRGNLLGMTGMAIAVLTTLAQLGAADEASTWLLIVLGLGIGGLIGAYIARRIPMTSMPELVAAFHSLVGLAAVLVAAGALNAPEAFGIGAPGSIAPASLFEMSLGVAIGAITFAGSVIAFAKLSGRMSGKPIILPLRHAINIALIVTGALVGSSGAILSYIMCHGMNRSFVSVILGGFGGETGAPAGGAEQRPVKLGSAEDAAFLLKNSGKVIIVPGYGMAVAQAQHALREMGDQLKRAGVEVKYAIHPVAGRMPGHMNVLLAEANVPYDEVFELEDINNEFSQADVAYVIGANDVTNPAAEEDKSSPIYGMPVLQVWKAGTVMFNKRSLASGYAGIDNPLFYRDNTMMLLGDAKKMTEEIGKAMAH